MISKNMNVSAGFLRESSYNTTCALHNLTVYDLGKQVFDVLFDMRLEEKKTFDISCKGKVMLSVNQQLEIKQKKQPRN